jgi:hypothetical protein
MRNAAELAEKSAWEGEARAEPVPEGGSSARSARSGPEPAEGEAGLTKVRISGTQPVSFYEHPIGVFLGDAGDCGRRRFPAFSVRGKFSEPDRQIVSRTLRSCVPPLFHFLIQHRPMFSFPKNPKAVAGVLRGLRKPMVYNDKSVHALDAVAARIAAPTERSLDEFLRERNAGLKQWQQRRY